MDRSDRAPETDLLRIPLASRVKTKTPGAELQSQIHQVQSCNQRVEANKKQRTRISEPKQMPQNQILRETENANQKQLDRIRIAPPDRTETGIEICGQEDKGDDEAKSNRGKATRNNRARRERDEKRETVAANAKRRERGAGRGQRREARQIGRAHV